jgi:hypothetical protein
MWTDGMGETNCPDKLYRLQATDAPDAERITERDTSLDSDAAEAVEISEEQAIKLNLSRFTKGSN